MRITAGAATHRKIANNSREKNGPKYLLRSHLRPLVSLSPQRLHGGRACLLLSYLVVEACKLDLRSVLRLLMDVKSDHVQLWSQVLDLKESMGDVSVRFKASEEKLAVRQIYCALNEKMLRRAAAHLGINMDAFWKKYKGSNIKSLQYRPELQRAWSDMQAQLGFGETPGELWNIIVDGRHEFDHFVHDGSFTKLSSELLRKVAETVFVGDKARHKHGFLYV